MDPQDPSTTGAVAALVAVLGPVAVLTIRYVLTHWRQAIPPELAEPEHDHHAEIVRLTAERDAARAERDHVIDDRNAMTEGLRDLERKVFPVLKAYSDARIEAGGHLDPDSPEGILAAAQGTNIRLRESATDHNGDSNG